jgi:RHS repeat-associated protein
MDGSNVFEEYIYNGKEQRADKLIPSQNKCTVFHYDQNGLLITETTRTGNIKAEYVYLNGQPLAKIENNNIYYYHNDHLETPMMMTDSAGSTVWQGEFKPFGEPLSVSGSITNNLRFPGQYYDNETGLHQNYFRDYKPEIGRYPEADPIGIKGGINLFVYVLNNPVSYTDQLGLDTYMCKKPLDASGSVGPYIGPNIPGSPFYHQYICVVNEQGVQCEGQSSAGGKVYGEGSPSNDTFSSSGCEKVATNKCIEECVLNKGSKIRPKYGLVGPYTNCQEWATDTFNNCVSQCF